MLVPKLELSATRHHPEWISKVTRLQYPFFWEDFSESRTHFILPTFISPSPTSFLLCTARHVLEIDRPLTPVSGVCIGPDFSQSSRVTGRVL